jgi:hypothetical protein
MRPGVDSLERSIQEDTLLVLFNTAISNLVGIMLQHLSRIHHPQVLFRNNFVFSRDIKGLFQSFQSSSAVLDPAANPSLFQSKLVVIIKVVIPCISALHTLTERPQDVVDSDSREIKRE